MKISTKKVSSGTCSRPVQGYKGHLWIIVDKKTGKIDDNKTLQDIGYKTKRAVLWCLHDKRKTVIKVIFTYSL
jgi:hypothetical protein